MASSEPLADVTRQHQNQPGERLAAVLAAVLGVAPEEIADESSPETIATWDSLNHLNLVMAIEGEFAVSLSADDVMEMGTVARMRAILRQYGVEA